MHKPRFLTLLAACCLIGLALAACSLTPASPTLQPTQAELEPSPTVQPPSPSAAPPTSTPLPPTATATSTPVPFPWITPQPGTVVLDFVALACRSLWGNGARNIPCPGDPNDLTEGYIAPSDQAVAEGGIPVEAPVLIGLPGLGGEHGAGLFGTFPPLLIQPGDTFHAVLSCQEGSSCDVEFALEYIDARGNYKHEMNWSWMHSYGGGPVPVEVDLRPLADQTVQLILVVRDQGTPEDDWVLWIYPYVSRAAP